MQKKIIIILVVTILIASVFPAIGVRNKTNIDKIKLISNFPKIQEEFDYGDAPEGLNKMAYPSLGITGSFPTCKDCGPGLWVEHKNFGAYFGSKVDLETEGNAGKCPHYCFPPYNQDESFNDNDAGLIIPEPFTITNNYKIIPCSGGSGTSLGNTSQTVVWGSDVDIKVTNQITSQISGYFNLIIDFNQNGFWGDRGEHVVVNFFPIPYGYSGAISLLDPPSFEISENPGYVWARFSITEKPVPLNWEGDGNFDYGESEDYLLLIGEKKQPDLCCEGKLEWLNVKPGEVVCGDFNVKNCGEEDSLLNWHLNATPEWGEWEIAPKNGTNLAANDTVIIGACVSSPNIQDTEFIGKIIIYNSDTPNDYCEIDVLLKTRKSRNRSFYNTFMQQFLNQYFIHFLLMLKLNNYS